ncbi:MAG: DNA alkylation repair protein [Magnetovibrio sp.]|nr:DNA alkylation repair protein [Magnetovibrio sp.]
MPEPFKNLFNPNMIALMASHLKRVWSQFDEPGFVAQATNNLEKLELKERANQIEQALEDQLPSSFSKAAPILVSSLHPEDDVDLRDTSMDEHGIRGWAILPMTQYVGKHGLDDFDLGLDVQKELTKRFSSEFGIRHFILQDQDRALATLSQWAKDQNYHVRRLVSEGSRPRLPWAMQLPELIKNPDPLFPILEQLKDDPKEYVRRSVANNLNDVAKDHPDQVAAIANQWMKGASPERKKLIRHACRTLVKQGHANTLSALGYKKPQVTIEDFEVLTPKVQFGNKLEIELTLCSDSTVDQDLILDYVIHHQKANGTTTPKVFKWKTFCLKAGQSPTFQRSHPIKTVTTRTYYPGTHQVEIQLNGVKLGSKDFELVME